MDYKERQWNNEKKVALRTVSKYFNKYLTCDIKGATNKVKEKKLKEFLELIEGV